MPGRRTEPETVAIDDRGSFSWVERGPALRASSAIALGGGCIVCDPVDWPGLDAALEPIGPPAAVWTLLSRHRRDGAAVAARHGVPFLSPAQVRAATPPAGVQVRLVAGSRTRTTELALWLPDRGLLVSPETFGTVPWFRAREGDRLGVHPIARLRPPRAAFAGIVPATIAVGHGGPLRDDAAAAIADALRSARADLPRAYVRIAVLTVTALLRRRAASRA